MGITHHSNYIRFMEEARVDMMDQLGYGYERMEAEGVLSPVMAVSCQYKHPSRFQETLDIQVSVKSLTDLKVGFSYVMKVGDSLVCTAESTHCFLRGQRPVSLRKEFPLLYQSLQEMLPPALD